MASLTLTAEEIREVNETFGDFISGRARNDDGLLMAGEACMHTDTHTDIHTDWGG